MIQVNVYPPSFTGVQNAIPEDIIVYPNPTNSTITLKVSGIQGHGTIRLFDALGKQVFQQSFESNELSQGTTIDMTRLNRGVYFLKIQTEEGNRVMKVVKN